MSNEEVKKQGCPASVEQPDILKAFLAGVSAARRQVSMYGGEHPNSKRRWRTSERINEFADVYERPTCVLTRDAVIANQHYYAASLDSVEMHERLHARGAMAFTIVGEPPPEQVREFLAFLECRSPRGEAPGRSEQLSANARRHQNSCHGIRIRCIRTKKMTTSEASRGDGKAPAMTW